MRGAHLLVLVLTFSAPLAAQDLLASYRGGNYVDVLNRTTGAIISSVNLTLGTQILQGSNGLAIDPTTGITYIVLDVFPTGRVLCTLNTANGTCTQIGVLADFVASIAFTNTGQLYALSGKGGVLPSTLYTVNKATAAMTVVLALGNGDAGEAIGFNSNNGLMYHLSGFSTVFYETINLTTLAVTPIAHSLPQEEGLAMAFDPAANDFFASVNVGYKVVKVSLTGTQTVIGAPRANQLARVKGLAVIPAVLPPFIQASTPSVNLGSTTQGTASAAVSFTVQGSNLTANLTVTSPAPVVVSTTGPAAGFGPSVALVPAAGSVPVTTIYVRIAASAPQGPVSVNIACASAGAITVNVIANGQVDPPPTPEMDLLRSAIPVPDGSTDVLPGAAVAGLPQSVTYTILNNSVAVLNLTGTPRVAVAAGANLTSVAVIVQPGPTLASNASVNFTINYEVTLAGAFDFTISIDNDDPNESPYNWFVSGTGLGEPNMGVTRPPTSIADGGTDNAGSHLVGLAFTMTYDVTNTGTDVLNIVTPITIANTAGCSVTVLTQPGTQVAVAGGTQLAISVTPTATGAFSFEVIIGNDDPARNPYDWVVSGPATGLPEINVARGATGLPDGSTDALGSHPAGAAITLVYTISNIGTASLTITLPVVISGQANCAAAVAAQPATAIAPNATTQLELTVTPVAAGSFSVDVSLANDDGNESPYDFSISGTATAVISPAGSAAGGGGSGGCLAAQGAAAPLIPMLALLASYRRRRRVA